MQSLSPCLRNATVPQEIRSSSRVRLGLLHAHLTEASSRLPGPEPVDPVDYWA